MVTDVVDLRFNEMFRRSERQARPIRVGLLLDDWRVESFVSQIVDDVLHSRFATLACVVTRRCTDPGSGNVPTTANLVSRVLSALMDPGRRRKMAYTAYQRLIDARRRPSHDPLALVSLEARIGHLPRLDVAPVSRGYSEYFPADATDWLIAQDLDVLLRFGFNILRGEVLQVARHGIWSFHHGDSDRYRGGPPHLWELIERHPESGVVLQRLGPALDAGILLRKAIFSTADSLAESANRFAPYWGSTHFVIQCLRALYESGWEDLEQGGPPPEPYRGERRIYRTPDTGDVLRWLLPSVARSAQGRLGRSLSGRRRIERWHLGVRMSDRRLYERPEVDVSTAFHWIPNPPGRYRADPFLIQQGGRCWLFAEEFEERSDRGIIVAGAIDGDRNPDNLVPVLSAPHHLSYPHVFEHDGAVYMVPETRAAGDVQLWRATAFPGGWEKVATLLDLPCVDCTLHFEQGRWWMLASPSSVSGHAPETYLFSSDRLFSGWRLHSLMPVCSTVRRARSAGALVRDGLRLIRPSQDCAGRYGRALVFSDVEWGPRGYAERPFATVAPPDDGPLIGVHSYARSGDLEVIDGLFVET